MGELKLISFDEFISHFGVYIIMYPINDLVSCYDGYIQLIENTCQESGFLKRDELFHELYIQK